MAIGSLVKQLRTALGLSQAQLASNAGGQLTQSHIAKIERGTNHASTARMRAALARGFGLSTTEVDEYLAERLPLTTAASLSRRLPSRATAGTTTPRRNAALQRAHEATTASEVDAIDRALLDAAHRCRSEPADFDVVRAAFHFAAPYLHSSTDWSALLPTWLAAAATLRKDDVPLSPSTLYAKVAFGKAWRGAARPK